MVKKILVFLLSVLFIIQQAQAVSVAPLIVEINANKAKKNYISGTIDIQGDKNQLKRLKVYAVYFKINDKGKIDFLDRNTNDEHNLSKKIRFVPSEFNVLPGHTQKLRINIPDVNKLPDGESRALLFIENIDGKEYGIKPSASNIGAVLVLKTRMGVPIYVDKGNFTKKGEIEYFKADENKNGKYTEFKINSSGNSKIRYNAKIQIIQGKKLIDEYDLTSHAVGDKNFYISKDKIQTNKIEANGIYTIKLVLSYLDEKGKKKFLTKETQLNINNSEKL